MARKTELSRSCLCLANPRSDAREFSILGEGQILGGEQEIVHDACVELLHSNDQS
jgi:hypothetical protein